MKNMEAGMLLAGVDYGKNFATWGLDQLFWVALVVGLVGVVSLVVKKKTIEGVISAVVVGIVCFFIKNPTKLSELGEKLATIIGL